MKLQLDHSSSTPLYLQAEKLLKEMTEMEEYKNGKLLPNEVYLSEQLKISRNTLRQAINKLVNEGLLVRKKGFGTKVAQKRVLSEARNWMSFSQEMRALGINVHNFELHVSWKIPTSEAMQFFDIPATRRLLALERLRGKKDCPFVYFISLFSPNLALTGNEDFAKPLYETLETNLGVKVTTSKEEISAAASSEFIAGKLNIPTGAPILIRRRYVYDLTNTPIEYNVGYYRADSFTYTIECSNR